MVSISVTLFEIVVEPFVEDRRFKTALGAYDCHWNVGVGAGAREVSGCDRDSVENVAGFEAVESARAYAVSHVFLTTWVKLFDEIVLKNADLNSELLIWTFF